MMDSRSDHRPVRRAAGALLVSVAAVLFAAAPAIAAQQWTNNNALDCGAYQVMAWSTSTGSTTHVHYTSSGPYTARWANGSVSTYRLSAYATKVNIVQITSSAVLSSANRGCDS